MGQPRETPCCGGTIKAIRLSRNLTQDELAQAAGVSRSAIAQWETNRANFGLKAKQLAEALDVPVKNLRVADNLAPGGRPPGEDTSEAEHSLLRCFRELLEDDRSLVLQLARRLSSDDTATNGTA